MKSALGRLSEALLEAEAGEARGDSPFSLLGSRAPRQAATSGTILELQPDTYRGTEDWCMDGTQRAPVECWSSSSAAGGCPASQTCCHQTRAPERKMHRGDFRVADCRRLQLLFRLVTGPMVGRE
uniref:Uncharacterized protein n=1 Tax=Sphaerodactylus townsendi TaxID=933632 RepID=A0ACB8G7B9_9SAUR